MQQISLKEMRRRKVNKSKTAIRPAWSTTLGRDNDLRSSFWKASATASENLFKLVLDDLPGAICVCLRVLSFCIPRALSHLSYDLMLFCPSCSNLLVISTETGYNKWACNTCAYEFPIAKQVNLFRRALVLYKLTCLMMGEDDFQD